MDIHSMSRVSTCSRDYWEGELPHDFALSAFVVMDSCDCSASECDEPGFLGVVL